MIGSSDLYDGASYLGASAWLYDANSDSTTRIGLFDSEHTADDGRQYSQANFVAESGDATGSSTRYAGAEERGDSAWFYDASDASATRIGFFDAAHTMDDGYQFSAVMGLAESGYAIGTSTRSDSGGSAWLYDASDDSTTRIGFFDAAHTQGNGIQYSEVHALTASGYVAGSSLRSDLGQSTWLYDASDQSTTRVGLFDATHTRADGFQRSVHSLLTESGHAAGYSIRYTGSEEKGISAWVFDASDGSQESIILSESSDGSAYSEVYFLGEDGRALGSYQLFDVDDSDLGLHAFAWTPEDGALDLGALVFGGLGAEGWERLAQAIQANGLGMIVGSGLLLSGGDLDYLLIPGAPIPEPGTGLLVATGLLGLALGKQRVARR